MFNRLYKKIKDILGRPTQERDDLGLGIDTRRDWKILCALFVLFFAVIFFVDYYLFYRVDVFGGGASPLRESLVSEFDMKKLNGVIKDWQGRVREFDKRAGMVPKIVDPSL